MFAPNWSRRIRLLKELQNAKKFRPPNKSKDAAGLNSLLGFLNDNRVTGAIVPKGEVVNAIPESSGATEPIKAAPVVEQPTPLPQSASQGSVAPISLNKIVFSGRFLSGKDFVAAAASLKIFSLAEPLYALQKLFFGSDDKTLPGAREFLQTAGQIGRGELSAALPISIERANFIALVREKAHRDLITDSFSVDWTKYGKSQDLWLDALLRRVSDHLAENPGARVAVTNARFSNELTRLTAEGFTHFHCMTSAATWSARLQKVGLMPESPATKDVSEQLAASLDANVIKTLSKAKHGPKLRCVWSDEKQQPPSSRLLTVAEFAAMFPK